MFHDIESNTRFALKVATASAVACIGKAALRTHCVGGLEFRIFHSVVIGQIEHSW